MVSAPMFGREQELVELDSQLGLLAEGEGSVVILTGDVGMGKTHLLKALHKRIIVKSRMGWAEGIGLAYGQTLSGYLVIDILRDLLALSPNSDPTQTARQLEAFCVDVFGAPRRDATYPYLARFMGMQLAGEDNQRLEGLCGESVRWQTFALIQEMVAELAHRRPLVLSLDDLQWADPTSLQLVESLLPLTQTAPLLLLLAMRPDAESRAWTLCADALNTRPTRVLNLSLSDLELAAARALLLHHAPELPAEMADRLAQRVGGNPLFLVETARTMQLQEEINWDAIDIDDLDLPDSVQGLLLAQIDRLNLEARHTLQMAAVIGPQFLYNVLDAIAAGEQQLDQSLAELQGREHILEDDPTAVGPSYLFRHILIQESAYSTLLYEHRRRYHVEVAATLEALFPEQMEEQAPVLAFHYEQAGELDKAVKHHLSAADQARLLYANEEADAVYRKALALMDEQAESGADVDIERQARTYLKLAQVRSQAFDFEGAQAYYEQAFGLFDMVEQTQKPGPEDGRDRTFRSAVLKHGPLSLDPGLAEVRDVSEIVYDLFEGLLELDSELNVMPALARRWRVSEGGKRYEFQLKPNLRWSDGVPLTAHDFVFAWQRNLSPETDSGLAPNLYLVKGAEAFHQGKNADPNSIGIRALDDLHLEIELDFPVGYFPFVLTDRVTYPLPAHAFQQHGAAWSRPENLVCNGPFVIDRWEEGVEIRLKRNLFYGGFAVGNLDFVSLRYVEPLFEQYESGTIDWYRTHDRAAAPMAGTGQSFLLQEPGTFFVAFACAHPPFDQGLVRKAFAQSIDRQALLREVQAETYKPALGGVVPPGIVGHSPEIGLPFDPEATRRHLRAAGYESGGAHSPLILATLPLANSPARYLRIQLENASRRPCRSYRGHAGRGHPHGSQARFHTHGRHRHHCRLP